MSSPPPLQQVTRALFPFYELWVQLSKVFDTAGSEVSLMGKMNKSLFYVLFAVGGMLSMGVQLLFPPIFMILVIYMPLCY
jgi:hypothetical protein